MHKVIRSVNEHTAIAEAKWNAGEDWRDPVHIRCAGPGEDHLTDRDAYRRDTYDADHGFRRWTAGGWIRCVSIDHFADERFRRDAEK